MRGSTERFIAAVKLVQTLVVRDEVDIVDAQIAYHLNAGVDFVIATDHESQDGTTDILESYARAGYLHVIHERGAMRDGLWRTRMARLAASEHRADWVINTDADEFWMPRRGSLKDVFAAVPEGSGVVYAVSRHFVPRPDDGALFAERMVARFSSAAALNDPTSPYRPHGKAAHRGDPEIIVRYGAHRVESRHRPLAHWHPAEVLHFPYRSLEQYERKTVRRAHSDSRLAQYVKGFQAREGGRVQDVYRAMLIDDDVLAKGRESGALVVDTRLRDVLRALRGGDGSRSPSGFFRLPEPGDGFVFSPAVGDDDVATDAQAFRDAEVVRLVRFVADLGARLEDVEDRGWARFARRVSRAAKD